MTFDSAPTHQALDLTETKSHDDNVKLCNKNLPALRTLCVPDVYRMCLRILMIHHAVFENCNQKQAKSSISRADIMLTNVKANIQV